MVAVLQRLGLSNYLKAAVRGRYLAWTGLDNLTSYWRARNVQGSFWTMGVVRTCSIRMPASCHHHYEHSSMYRGRTTSAPRCVWSYEMDAGGTVMDSRSRLDYLSVVASASLKDNKVVWNGTSKDMYMIEKFHGLLHVYRSMYVFIV